MFASLDRSRQVASQLSRHILINYSDLSAAAAALARRLGAPEPPEK